MLQPGRRLGLGAEALRRPRSSASRPARIIFRATMRLRLDLPGLVDDAHAAAGDLAEQLVVAELARRGVAGKRHPGPLRQGRRIVRGWAGLGGRWNNRWFYFWHDEGNSFDALGALLFAANRPISYPMQAIDCRLCCPWTGQIGNLSYDDDGMATDLIILGTDTDAGKTTFALLWLSAFSIGLRLLEAG